MGIFMWKGAAGNTTGPAVAKADARTAYAFTDYNDPYQAALCRRRRCRNAGDLASGIAGVDEQAYNDFIK